MTAVHCKHKRSVDVHCPLCALAVGLDDRLRAERRVGDELRGLKGDERAVGFRMALEADGMTGARVAELAEISRARLYQVLSDA